MMATYKSRDKIEWEERTRKKKGGGGGENMKDFFIFTF